VKLSVETTGVEETARVLEARGDALTQPMAPLLERLTQSWVSKFQADIRQGNLDLPPLRAETLAIRRFYGHTGPPLVRSGELVDSIRGLELGDSHLDVGTDTSFAALLQGGGEVTDKRGRKHTVQAFPFVVVDDALLDESMLAIEEHFLPEAT
jgi:phage gpG-like protein